MISDTFNSFYFFTGHRNHGSKITGLVALIALCQCRFLLWILGDDCMYVRLIAIHTSRWLIRVSILGFWFYQLSIDGCVEFVFSHLHCEP